MAAPVAIAIVTTFALSGVLSLALGVSAHRNRETPAAEEFRNFAVAGGMWALLELVVLVAPTPGAARTIELAALAVGLLVIASFLVFVFIYTSAPRLSRPSAVRGIYAGAAVYWAVFVLPVSPLAVTLRVSTFRGLLLVEQVIGPWYVAATLGIYVLVFAAWGHLLRLVLDSTNVYRKQAAIVFVSSLLVVSGATARVLGLVPPGLKVGVAMRALEAGLIWIAIFRYDFLSIMPLARDALVDTIDDPVFVLDDDGAVVYANDAARELRAGDVDRGTPAESALDGLLDAVERDDKLRVAAADEVAFDGGDRVFSPRATALRDQYGDERGQVIVLHDVTEQKRRERRLEEFASVVSHDLRNPLSVADGYVRESYARTDDDALAEALVSLERMDEMIDELLTLAREGYGQISPTALTLSTVATDAWRTVSTSTATLELDDADRTVVADEPQLRELFENLFRNAIDHNDGAVTVRVGATDEGFYVADDGEGIPPDERERVFDTGYTTAADGTGVGLHVVERFVEAHGWSISVSESAEGGARFDVSTMER